MVLPLGRPHIDRSAEHCLIRLGDSQRELPRARLSPEQARILARHQDFVVEAGDAVKPVERSTGAARPPSAGRPQAVTSGRR
jgi:hypothetical protein